MANKKIIIPFIVLVILSIVFELILDGLPSGSLITGYAMFLMLILSSVIGIIIGLGNIFENKKMLKSLFILIPSLIILGIFSLPAIYIVILPLIEIGYWGNSSLLIILMNLLDILFFIFSRMIPFFLISLLVGWIIKKIKPEKKKV